MCRQSLNFKGLHRLEEKWSEEAREQKIDEIFGEFVDSCLEEGLWLDFALYEISEAQQRLNQISDWEFDHDLFEGIVYDAIEIIKESPPREYREPKTFEHTLFAKKGPIRNKTGKGVKRGREFKAVGGMDFIDFIVVI